MTQHSPFTQDERRLANIIYFICIVIMCCALVIFAALTLKPGTPSQDILDCEKEHSSEVCYHVMHP